MTDIVAFAIEERTSKNGKKYTVLLGITKDGSKYFINFVRKTK